MNRFKKARRKKKFLKALSVVLIIMTLFLGGNSINQIYARYKSDIGLNVTANTGGLECSMKVDYDSSYVENNVPYFYVYIYNYNTDGTLTDVDIDYSLKITTNDNLDITFNYVDSLGNRLNEYTNSLDLTDYSFSNDSKEEMLFKVYVKYLVEDATDVKVNVVFDAEQAIA